MEGEKRRDTCKEISPHEGIYDEKEHVTNTFCGIEDIANQTLSEDSQHSYDTHAYLSSTCCAHAHRNLPQSEPPNIRHNTLVTQCITAPEVLSAVTSP
jgi:hypothetical protein